MEIIKFSGIALIAILLFSCVPDKSAPTSPDDSNNPEVTPEAVQWLKDNTIPLYETELSDGYGDLMPLKSIIGTARIVGIGEMTCGAHECQSMKLRLIDFLVKEMDFNIVCMDLPYPETFDINNHIQTMEGNPKDLLLESIWWRQFGLGPKSQYNKFFLYNQETLDIIAWMREYNRNSNSKLEFVGRGVLKPHRAMTNVVEYLNAVDSTISIYVDSLYGLFQTWGSAYPFVHKSIKDIIQTNIQIALDTLKTQRTNYVNASSVDEYEKALFFAEFVVNAEKNLLSNSELYRDIYRADLVQYIMNEAPANSKMIILGYNNEVGNMAGNFGNILKNEYNQDYFSLASSVYEGYFFARILNPDDGSYSIPCLLELPDVPADSYEEHFHSAEIPNFILDIQSNLQPLGSKATDWLRGPLKMKQIGQFFEPNDPQKYFETYTIINNFDAIIHFDVVTESELWIVW